MQIFTAIDFANEKTNSMALDRIPCGLLRIREFRNSIFLHWAIQAAQLSSVGSKILFLQDPTCMNQLSTEMFTVYSVHWRTDSHQATTKQALVWHLSIVTISFVKTVAHIFSKQQQKIKHVNMCIRTWTKYISKARCSKISYMGKQIHSYQYSFYLKL
jgi:hypothetical protein